MTNNNWTKQELVAYTLLYVAHSDLEETKKERHYILSRVDLKTYLHIKEEFDADNDYQSLNKIIEAVKHESTYNNNLDDLFADIKLMAFADGEVDQMELATYNVLKKILS
ncbi:hypothetical protein [Psychroserpens luteus]|uniref:Tellurite resistance protein TerB n=1 Tax=Psychroserpens luteus TaxID=1434066 RepID=A0ABW5ZZ89_9FLAO|nr:hypothetical protein [Psychroserpens luteus]